MKDLNNLDMGNAIIQYMKEHGICAEDVARGTGLSAQRVRSNLTGLNRISLETYLYICEYLAKATDQYTHDMIMKFLQYNSSYQNAITRDMRRQEKCKKTN